jgi:hypothetical protein
MPLILPTTQSPASNRPPSRSMISPFLHQDPTSETSPSRLDRELCSAGHPWHTLSPNRRGEHPISPSFLQQSHLLRRSGRVLCQSTGYPHASPSKKLPPGPRQCLLRLPEEGHKWRDCLHPRLRRPVAPAVGGGRARLTGDGGLAGSGPHEASGGGERRGRSGHACQESKTKHGLSMDEIRNKTSLPKLPKFRASPVSRGTNFSLRARFSEIAKSDELDILVGEMLRTVALLAAAVGASAFTSPAGLVKSTARKAPATCEYRMMRFSDPQFCMRGGWIVCALRISLQGQEGRRLPRSLEGPVG